jgi:hypothetical protein
MDIVTEWKQLVGDIRDAALELFANAEVARTDRGYQKAGSTAGPFH